MADSFPGRFIRMRLVFITAFSLFALASPASASYTAELMYSKTPLYKNPGGKIRGSISNFTHSGQRARLMVLGLKGKDGKIWVKVRLPKRPNTAKAWINSERVSIHKVDYRVVIDRSERRLRLYKGNRLVARRSVVVGKPSTPTPLGRFAVWDKYRPPWGRPTRPLVLELTAHSNVLKTFDGGEARVAMHGMRDELKAPLGTARSNGCIRLSDGTVRLLRKRLTLGAPVTVRD